MRLKLQDLKMLNLSLKQWLWDWIMEDSKNQKWAKEKM